MIISSYSTANCGGLIEAEIQHESRLVAVVYSTANCGGLIEAFATAYALAPPTNVFHRELRWPH